MAVFTIWQQTKNVYGKALSILHAKLFQNAEEREGDVHTHVECDSDDIQGHRGVSHAAK